MFEPDYGLTCFTQTSVEALQYFATNEMEIVASVQKSLLLFVSCSSMAVLVYFAKVRAVHSTIMVRFESQFCVLEQTMKGFEQTKKFKRS